MAFKLHELNIKRDLEIEYVDAEGNALKNEAIDLEFSERGCKDSDLGRKWQSNDQEGATGPIPFKSTETQIGA